LSRESHSPISTAFTYRPVKGGALIQVVTKSFV
jgi:hypothetical protein